MELQTLYRPVGSNELAWIIRSGWTRFPARLIKEPVFYPIIDDAFIAQKPVQKLRHADRAACIIRFHVIKDYLSKHAVNHVDADMHTEVHLSPDAIDELNNNIIGLIEITGI